MHGVLLDLFGGAWRAFAASGSPMEFFTLLARERVMKGSVGLGVDGFKLAGEGADNGCKLINFSMGRVAESGLAEVAVSLPEAILKRLGNAVGFSEDRESLAALGLCEIEAAREVVDAAFGEGFVVVVTASTGLSVEEENETEEENQSAHGSFLSS